MAILEIRIFPDPVLRSTCPAVETFDEDLHRLVDDMVETMYAAPGVGLAAPQVGVEKRLAVVDVSVSKEPERLLVLINPEIVESSGREVDFEGCLSIPQLSEKIARPTHVRVRAQDLDGVPFELEAEEFEARAICHELDHLDGVLFIDHLKGLRRDRIRRKLRKLELV
ncbi:MAG: peptide deformylase [Thermoanaerobaculia bacterium]|nr:peptide deformylase [Thermoanaerobaculia bacterium]